MLISLLLLSATNPFGIEVGRAEQAYSACLQAVVRTALRARQPAEAFQPIFDAACPAERAQLEAAAFKHALADNPPRTEADRPYSEDGARRIAAGTVQHVRDHQYGFYHTYMTARPYN